MKIQYSVLVAFCVLGPWNGSGLGSQTLGENSNWPQWRGPSGTGVTSAADVVTTWGPAENVKWRIKLPEAGNSTPVV